MARFQEGWKGPILECRDLCISYTTRAADIPAVVNFNLTLNRGETVGLVGESGCGKTTVAMAVMRYLGHNGRISGGQILYKGVDMATLSAEQIRQLRGSEIAMVYQEPMASLNPSMKCGRQLMEVPIFHEGVSESEAWDRSIQLLHDVKLPDPERVMNSFPHQISGGQQQRVVIAMALLSRPSLLLLDEPTTALDVTVEAGIVELIAELAQKLDTSMMYISHNLGLILETCDRICVMYSGEAVEEGTVEEVFDQMRHPYTQGLFGAIPLPTADKNARPLTAIRGQLPLPHERPPGCNFGPRCDHFQKGRCDGQDIPMLPVTGEPGHEVRCVRWNEIGRAVYKGSASANKNVDADSAPVLSIDRMKKYYELRDSSLAALIRGRRNRYVKANEKISFMARAAETVAIVGESGCGKSTFAKVLMGLETATEGRVEFRGKDIGAVPVQKRKREDVRAMQMIFQNPFDTLNPSHTVGGQLSRVIRKFGGVQGEEVRRRVLELLDIVKLPADFYFRRPRQLSGGQKQRVGIARAFAGNPTVVVADEPVSALDVSVAAAVTGLLMEIQRTYRTTLLFISHDLSLVRYLADRVVVMYLGHIVEQGTTDEVFSPPYHPYTEALLSAVPIADTSIEKKRIILEGNLPSVINPPKGCPFNTRCQRKIGEICETEPPPEVEASPGHFILCHIPIEVLRKVDPVIVQKDKANAAE